MSGVTLEFGGATLGLRADRSLFWEQERTLVVADLHLGKGESFRAAGIPLGGDVLAETLDRLGRAVDDAGAERLIVLGDLVHARGGLTERVIESVGTWLTSRKLDVTLVRGNHDRHLPLIPPSWPLRDAGESASLGALALGHEPLPDAFAGAATSPRLCGHLHPTVVIASRNDALRLPCFVAGATELILPAFTVFSRGVIVEPKPDRRVFAIADGELIEILGRGSRGADAVEAGGR